ncbi:MAG TPA: insulinase family protein, partial [Xanthomonadales bacterium]|nr:insulinase family protein [Xanthomonadales bacterium]
AGDIDVKTAKEKVQRYFGDIPPGPPTTKKDAWTAERRESTRDTMYDRVAQTMILRRWNVPGVGTRDADLLDLASQVLGGSAASRLDERLVHKDRIADSVSAFNYSQELGGQFILQALVKTTSEPAAVEKVLDEEVQRLLAEGPTEAELERAKTVLRATFVRGMERIGGFGGKADILAQCHVLVGDADCYRTSLARVEAATPAEVRDVLRRWLAQGDYTLTVLPFPPFQAAKTDVDRKKGLPVVERFPDVSFPTLERDRLANGMEIVLARRANVPVVNVDILFDAGFASDQGRKLGTASFAMNMMDEGAGKLGALPFKARAEELGAQISSSASVDTSYVTLSALKDKLPESLDLFADVVLRPRFEDSEIERVRKQWLAGIAQEKTQPTGIALRLLPPLLYGDGHAYAMPFSGTGTEASISALTRADLVGYHADWIRPDNGTAIVAGDITMDEAKRLLDARFAKWKAPAQPKPTKNVATVERAAKPTVYLIDKPGSPQTIVIAGHVAPPTNVPNYLAINVMNNVFGGIFTSRLNLNLREAKNWSYGASSFLSGAKGQRPFIVYAPVQTDKTAESIAEVTREFADYLGKKPATPEEIAKVKQNDIRSMPGEYETLGAVQGAVRGIVAYGRPDDWVQTMKPRLEALTDAEIHAAAREVMHPESLTWVIVGDLEKIEAPIRKLDLGPIKVMDVDGKVLR